MKHALLLLHWDGLEMYGIFNEHVQMELYRNKSSTMKPMHTTNFSTMVSEHELQSQLCQKNCGSGRTDEKGVAPTGSGDVSERQPDLVDVPGPCHGQEWELAVGAWGLVKGGQTVETS